MSFFTFLLAIFEEGEVGEKGMGIGQRVVRIDVDTLRTFLSLTILVRNISSSVIPYTMLYLGVKGNWRVKQRLKISLIKICSYVR